MKIRRLFGLILPLLVSAASLIAHPHVGVEITLQPETANGVLDGIAVTWVFDAEAYSREVFDGYDPDGDRVLDTDEIERLRVQAFQNVEDYGYFLFLSSGNEAIASPSAERFQAKLTDEKIIYSFYLPYRYRYEVSPSSRLKHFTFTLKDPSGFMEVKLSELKLYEQSGVNRTATYFVSERWEQFTFRHAANYASEMLVWDIQYFPLRS